MINGKKFKPGKAYKDSKLCNMLTMRELHRRYHDSLQGLPLVPSILDVWRPPDSSAIISALFRFLFPKFQRFITGGFVTEELAGTRVAQVVSDPLFGKSGVYWSWGNRQKEGRPSFEQEMSNESLDDSKAQRLWELS